MALDHFCLKGQDLELDDEAHQATTNILKIDSKLMRKIVQVIYSETAKVFELPESDSGVFGQLCRVQHMHMDIQRRVMAAT